MVQLKLPCCYHLSHKGCTLVFHPWWQRSLSCLPTVCTEDPSQ